MIPFSIESDMAYARFSSILNALLRALTQISFFCGKLLLFCDWGHGKHPQFFNHKIDYALWPHSPSKWSIAARGVLPRVKMFPGCTVLELCCGDGSNSFLYFTDIAAKVVGVDGDPSAIKFAKKNYRVGNLTFYELDIISGDLSFLGANFDFVVMNAALSYFEISEIYKILSKIKAISSKNSIFLGMVPQANGHIDHKNEFPDHLALFNFLKNFFSTVEISSVYEGNGIHYYFSCSDWI